MLALEGGAVTDLQQLINKPGIHYRPGGNIQELPLRLRQAVSAHGFEASWSMMNAGLNSANIY